MTSCLTAWGLCRYALNRLRERKNSILAGKKIRVQVDKDGKYTRSFNVGDAVFVEVKVKKVKLNIFLVIFTIDDLCFYMVK